MWWWGGVGGVSFTAITNAAPSSPVPSPPPPFRHKLHNEPKKLLPAWFDKIHTVDGSIMNAEVRYSLCEMLLGSR